MSQKKLTKRADGRYRVCYGSKQFYGKTKTEANRKREEYIASLKPVVAAPKEKHKRPDGRYKVTYRKKQFYGKTEEEAFRKRDAYIAELNAQATAAEERKHGNVPFTEYGITWVEAYRSQCQEVQQKSYKRVVQIVGEKLGDMKMSEITSTDLQRVINGLSSYSPSHANKYMVILRGIFRTAFAEGVIPRNPMEVLKRPRTKKCEGHRALEDWERELVTSTWQGHEFGLCAMVMLYAGLRRGEALYVDVDRDCDFEKNTLTVRGSVSFADGNQPTVTDGKTVNAQRTIPMVKPLADALRDHHGLLCTRENGEILSQVAYAWKYDSYITYLETQANGCHKRWYGQLKEHKKIIESGGTLPEWKEVAIRCHDFRVDFCTRAYYAGIPLKTLQKWMGHADMTMILKVYTKLSDREEEEDALKLAAYMEKS